MKLCKDCCHSSLGGYTGQYLCEHPCLGTEMTDGRKKWKYAEHLREDVEACGPEAKWFSPQPVDATHNRRVIFGICFMIGLILFGLYLSH